MTGFGNKSHDRILFSEEEQRLKRLKMAGLPTNPAGTTTRTLCPSKGSAAVPPWGGAGGAAPQL